MIHPSCCSAVSPVTRRPSTPVPHGTHPPSRTLPAPTGDQGTAFNAVWVGQGGSGRGWGREGRVCANTYGGRAAGEGSHVVRKAAPPEGGAGGGTQGGASCTGVHRLQSQAGVLAGVSLLALAYGPTRDTLIRFCLEKNALDSKGQLNSRLEASSRSLPAPPAPQRLLLRRAGRSPRVGRRVRSSCTRPVHAA